MTISDDGRELPDIFIQWKGTDVCMDVHCECGAHLHFDGFFAYYVECPHCSRIYKLGDRVSMTLVKREECHIDPRTCERDEDMDDAP